LSIWRRLRARLAVTNRAKFSFTSDPSSGTIAGLRRQCQSSVDECVAVSITSDDAAADAARNAADLKKIWNFDHGIRLMSRLLMISRSCQSCQRMTPSDRTALAKTVPMEMIQSPHKSCSHITDQDLKLEVDTGLKQHAILENSHANWQKA
jgi:hypothetical protein